MGIIPLSFMRMKPKKALEKVRRIVENRRAPKGYKLR